MGFKASVLTLYPEMFPGPLGISLAGKALAESTWSLDMVQIRDFAEGKHRMVDDTPSGGGAPLHINPCDQSGASGAIIEVGLKGTRIRKDDGQPGRPWSQPVRER